MQWLYQEYWKKKKDSRRIRKAFFFSILIHIIIFVPFYFYKIRTPEPIPLVFQVSLENPVPDKPITQEPPPEPPKPEPPKPEPPKPEPPKPEPPKPEPPKPEPPKPEPPKPKPKPKPEKKIPEEKPKEKPEPPKPKPEPKKEQPPPKEQKPTPKQEVPPVPSAPKAQVANPLPPELEWWARQVQRKIEYTWVVPSGIKIDNENNVAEVSFWVNRNGELLEQPVVTKEASDPELGESGVRAILLAAPFPRFPDGFNKDEQLVVYAFSLE